MGLGFLRGIIRGEKKIYLNNVNLCSGKMKVGIIILDIVIIYKIKYDI